MSAEITECLNLYGLEVIGTRSEDDFLWKYKIVPVIHSDHELTYQVEIEFGSEDKTLSDTACIAYISGHYKKPRGGIEDFELPDLMFSPGFVGGVDRDVRMKMLRAIYSGLPKDILSLELARPRSEFLDACTDLEYADVGLESGTLMCYESSRVLSGTELTKQIPLRQLIFGGKTDYVDLDSTTRHNSESGLSVTNYDSLEELSRRGGSHREGAFARAFRLGL